MIERDLHIAFSGLKNKGINLAPLDDLNLEQENYRNRSPFPEPVEFETAEDGRNRAFQRH